MKVTEEGLQLIRQMEGLRTTAYRDPVGIWTIGYGHTSQAGEPHVQEGLTITAEEADKILRQDITTFSEGVKNLITTPLNDNQFSALVSLAYNIGLENFKRSSVLKALNDKDFAAVPRRLQLWVKASGKPMPGLVKRRALEAALFAEPMTQGVAPKDTAQRPVTMQQHKPLQQSTTIWAAALAALLTFANHMAMLMGYGLAGLIFTAAIIGLALWIIRERRRKSAEEGV